MGKLEGKIAVVTGATEGMALETARRFAEEGAFIFITGRRQEKLDEAASAIGRNVSGVQCDSSNLSDLDRLYKKVKEEKGALDILFASAGMGAGAPTQAVTEESYDAIFDLNTRGTYFTVQKALPLLNENASVILNSSVANVVSMPGMSVYSGSKAALLGFVHCWVQELKAKKIRFNLISPGAINTAPFRALPKEFQELAASRSPFGRAGEPGEVASVALFLAGNDASYVNGQNIAVDSGFSIATM